MILRHAAVLCPFPPRRDYFVGKRRAEGDEQLYSACPVARPQGHYHGDGLAHGNLRLLVGYNMWRQHPSVRDWFRNGSDGA